jgi:hypothetical protein
VPITKTVSVSLSPPVRVFAFVGVLVAVGLVAFMFLLGSPESESVNTPATRVTTQPGERPKTTPRANGPVTPARRPRATVGTPSGFPAPVHRALRRHSVVVVVVYMPGASVDRVVRREARAAAIQTGAGLVAVSATSERLVQPLVAKTGVLPDPAVLVVTRPDVVVKTLGVTDRQAVAQAVVQARR